MAKKLSKKLKALRCELDFKCFKCKKGCFECCTAINMTEEELKRMNQALRKIRKKGIDKPPSGKGKDYCEYLNGNGQCSVYEERPVICRAFGRVNIPFLTCSYNRDCKRIKQSLKLVEYMKKVAKDSVGNKNGVPSNLMEKIKAGDVDSIMMMAQQIVLMREDGIINNDLAEEKIDQLERIMQRNNDSIYNHIKKPAEL